MSTSPGSARLTERVAGTYGPELELANEFWRLEVGLGDRLDPYQLLDLRTGLLVADESYCYEFTVAAVGKSGYSNAELSCEGIRPVNWSLEESSGSTSLVLVGQAVFGPSGPTNIRLEHRITLAGPSVVEIVSTRRGHGRAGAGAPTPPSRPGYRSLSVELFSGGPPSGGLDQPAGAPGPQCRGLALERTRVRVRSGEIQPGPHRVQYRRR